MTSPREHLRISGILLLFTILLCSAPSQRISLHFVGQLPDDANSLRAEFVSRLDGWLFSDRNIWSTHDGALTWQRFTAPRSDAAVSGGIDSVALFGDKGVVVRENRLFRTANGGKTWTELPHPPVGYQGGEIWGVRFHAGGVIGWAYGGIFRVAGPDEDGPNNAIKVDKHGVRLILEPAVWETADSGYHWFRENLPPRSDEPLGYRITDLYSNDSSHRTAVTETSAIYMRDGKNWHLGRIYDSQCQKERLLDSLGISISRLYIYDQQQAWLSLDDGSLYHSSDGGGQWCELVPARSIHSQFSDSASHFESLSFASVRLGWGVEVSGALLETQDGGKTWARVGPPNVRFAHIFFVEPNYGWVVSEDSLFRASVTKE